ncbi:DUF4139 domain-containing protein [Myroides sp. WP-1]|uniref:DUF4139 domain-containing protein n=1 Tax=Myroides sp. WP-1 TaxID=2759944 RepID=UPI0015F9F82F|nr:DUF4139 domain-containing protein [Myroides sp. WP-1]MBB1140175.1 DUF4139 domain-containing protein [Myroides sp. WP-1]
MKKGIVLAMALSAVAVWAQKPVYTKANLESARVYYDGAELTQNTQVTLPKGLSEVVITNVSDQLMENTIKVGSINDVTVMSVQFSNAYIEEYDNVNNSPLMKPLRDSIAVAELKLEKITNAINADTQTINLLDRTSTSQTFQTFGFTDVTKWVEYYGKKRQEVQNAMYLKKKEKEVIEAKWNALKGQLTLGGDKSERSSRGKLIVQVMSAKEGNIPFRINYATNRAQWIPSYDLRIDKINAPIKMMYKAQVVQTSGIDWRNVRLSLTSGKLNQNYSLPTWNTWFVQYEAPQEVIVNTGYSTNSRRKMTGAVARIAEKDLAVESNAYDMVAFEEVSYEDRQTLAEYTTVNQSELNVTFDIAIPYSILSNGKRHSVDLNTFDINGDYKFYSAPKLDANAYLVAEIKDYGKHNLLSGQANVIYDGMNIGQTYLSTENTEEKLRLNIGKDPNISISRTLIADKSGTKTLSSKKEQTFTYEISIKNNKKETVAVQVEDQYPVSTDNSIEVILNEVSKGTTEAEKGLITWNVSLQPNEVKKIRVSYTLKYSKDKNIENIHY